MRKIYKSLTKMRLNLYFFWMAGVEKNQILFKNVTLDLKWSVKFTQYKFVNLILNLRNG